MQLRNAIQLAYGLPGILSYTLVFCGMFGVRRVLSRSFIVIFCVMSASNIVTWLNAWVYLKLTNEPFFFFYYEWLVDRQLLIHIHSFLIPHFYYVQNIDLFLLTFDRFMAIRSIGTDTSWWKRYYLGIAVIVQSVALGVHLSARLPMVTKIRLDSIAVRYDFLEPSDNFMKPLAASIQLGFGFTIFIACSVINIFSLKFLRMLSKTSHASIERSFLLISFCIFISQSLNVFVACLIAAFNTSGRFSYEDFRTIYEIMYYTSDLFSLGPALAYGLPGILSYTLVFCGMFGVRRVLSRSFIVIFCVMSASNIVTWLNAWVYLKLTNEPFFFFYYEWLVDRQLLIHIHSFLIPHFYYVQNIDLFLLTFDRFMAIRSIGTDTSWWKRYYLGIAVIVQSVALGVHLSARLPMVTKIRLDSIAVRYDFLEPSDNFMKPLAASIQLGFGFTIFIACSVINIFSLKFLRMLSKTSHASIERSFLLISFCIFISQSLNVFVACLIAAFNTSGRFSYEDFRTIYEIMYYTSDLFSLGPAVYTILLPGPIRQFLIAKCTNFIRQNNEHRLRPFSTEANS